MASLKQIQKSYDALVEHGLCEEAEFDDKEEAVEKFMEALEEIDPDDVKKKKKAIKPYNDACALWKELKEEGAEEEEDPGEEGEEEEEEEEGEGEGEEEEEEEEKPKSKASDKKGKASDKKGKASDKKAEKSKGDKPKREPPKRDPSKPSVTETIVKFLKKATKTKPVSKDDILEHLVEEFPERNKSSMKATVNTLVPSDLRKLKGLDVQAIGERPNVRYYIPK